MAVKSISKYFRVIQRVKVGWCLEGDQKSSLRVLERSHGIQTVNVIEAYIYIYLVLRSTTTTTP